MIQEPSVLTFPKPPPLTLAMTSNYNLALQEIHYLYPEYPECINKLLRDYIKIYTNLDDEHRVIIAPFHPIAPREHKVSFSQLFRQLILQNPLNPPFTDVHGSNELFTPTSTAKRIIIYHGCVS
ncbi:hypothetical protein CEXT_317661 [Caerostris extrusa]|uniref:Uncharacterized protein n=1 Tax=Caerostris extrusa TaxID=172846 RepID=A0AAV4MWD4_CAEEX|nr:hypothetical protein CEXT_317661 [Caerostris extrusa]